MLGAQIGEAMSCRLIAATPMLIAVATACTTVATVRRPAQFITAKAPRIVWVTTTDNSQVALLSPRVRADTLGGLAEGVHYVEMPLSSVQSMRARQPAPRRTLLLVGGITLAVAGVAIAASRGGGPSSATACVNPNDVQTCPND
jgi:hypothetical protein